MRFLVLASVLALGACAAGAGADAPFPFPVERGSAIAPGAAPAAHAGAGRTAPPEGAGAAGFEFGQWRGADPATYAPALQTRVRARYAGQSNAQIRADLEANGFACEDGARLDCRIEIMERQCAHDWYVVVERGREPIAGYDVMCLGAR